MLDRKTRNLGYARIPLKRCDKLIQICLHVLRPHLSIKYGDGLMTSIDQLKRLELTVRVSNLSSTVSKLVASTVQVLEEVENLETLITTFGQESARKVEIDEKFD